jgi:hypothetical protein
MMPPREDAGYFEISLRGQDDDYPSLLDVSAFLYDFNLVYEFSRLATDPKYSGYTFSRYSWNRFSRPISAGDRLRVAMLRHESPLLFVGLVAAVPAAVGAVWGLVQIVEKIANLRVNREILILQRDKLKRELLEVSPDASRVLEDDTWFRHRIESQEAAYFYDRTGKRLEKSSIRITEFEVRVVRQLPERPRTDSDGSPG